MCFLFFYVLIFSAKKQEKLSNTNLTKILLIKFVSLIVKKKKMNVNIFINFFLSSSNSNYYGKDLICEYCLRIKNDKILQIIQKLAFQIFRKKLQKIWGNR